MKFTKMHGLGNDYVFVSTFDQCVENPAALARAISDRHGGVGSDGLILIHPSEGFDVRMEMYNADGSRAQMCGNGIRCVAKYVVERNLADGPELVIDTDSGPKRVCCHVIDARVGRVRVDMGVPILDPEAIPVALPGPRVVNHPLVVDDVTYRVTCVSMGNPHAVLFVDEPDAVDLAAVGPLLEQASIFPQRVNVHLAHVRSATRVAVRSWERGSGLTRACGTGACAVCVAGAITEHTGRCVTIELPGGELEIEWARDDHVFMTGPAVEVFSGEWSG